MVKPLEELCLTSISKHFKSYSRLGGRISARQKALLLERMCWHELFTPSLLPSISYHLFSNTLQWINLSYSSQVTDKTLEILSTCQCQPTSITISACSNVTDIGIASFSSLGILLKVEILTISKLKNLTGEGLKTLRTRSLKNLVLKECPNLKDPGVVQMIKNCPNITHLNLSWSFKLTDDTVVAAAETLHENLVEIHCSEVTGLTSVSTLALAKWCPSIKSASFDSCVKLTGEGLLNLAETCSLNTLRISFCYKLQPSELDILITTLKAKNSLSTLEIMGNTLGRFGVEFISTCKTLTHLLISGVNEITDDKLELICQELADTLVELDISTCTKLSDKACAVIAKHTRSLERLGMRNLNEFTGMGLTPMFQDPQRALNMKSITFSGTKTISPILVHIITTNCPNLEVLLLAGVKQITDDIVISLAHNCPNLTKCSLRNCDLTDTSICELSIHCNKLKMLAVAGIHSLTDKCVISLADNCPYIRELYLSGCAKITSASLMYLKDCAIRNVWIQHAVPNAPVGLLMAKDLDTGEYKRMDSTDIL